MFFSGDFNWGVRAAAATSGSALPVAYPVARKIRADDALVLMLAQNSLTAIADQTGFATIGKLGSTGGTASPTGYMGWKKATAAESGSFSAALQNGIGAWGQIVAIPGADLAAFLDLAATGGGVQTFDDQVSGSTTPLPSITPGGFARLFLNFATSNTNAQTAGIDSGYTENADGDGSIRSGQSSWLLPTDNTAHTATITWSGAGKQVDIHACIKPRPPDSALLMVA